MTFTLWLDLCHFHYLGSITHPAVIIGANRVNYHDAILVYIPGTHCTTG